MRILFVGTVDFSHHCLSEIISLGLDVCGVITEAPDRRHFNTDYANLEPLAGENGIPVYHLDSLKGKAAQTIECVAPDVILVLGYSKLIPARILKIPRLGCIGSHPALLPCNRGRHPLIWALIEDLKQSGLTFFHLEESSDSGDIVWQHPFAITDEDDAGTLYEKMKETATTGLREFLPALMEGRAQRVPQNHTEATYLRKRSERDGEVAWEVGSREVFNLIRALTRPYVGAHTHLGDRKISLWRGRPVAGVTRTASPGFVLEASENALVVTTGDGVIRLTEWDSGGATINQGDQLGGEQL